MRIKMLQEENEEEMKVEEGNKNDVKMDINEIKKDEELWRIGIVCKKDCFFLTQEILKILEKKGYEWKMESTTYKIKCRKKISKSSEEEKNENNSESFPKTGILNVLIQIFGDIDKHNKDEYLVDLHKLNGTVMEFLEFSSDFVSSLQQLGLLISK